MKKQKSQPHLGIPSETDWGDYRSDLDQEWAHEHYCGKSNEEMQKYFHNNAIESASDLQFMPKFLSAIAYLVSATRCYPLTIGIGVMQRVVFSISFCRS
jgi:hypothetical protein